DLRGELVVGVVAQVGGALGRRVVAGQDDGEDGEDRGRHLLDGELDVGGQLRADGADAVPGELRGPLHVGAGREVDGQLGAAADGLGADALDTDDGADGLFQRHGDL